MDDKKARSKAAIADAISSITGGRMDPWFHSRQTCREWFSRQDSDACADMVPEILDSMVALRLDGRFNAGAKLCDVLVHAVERSRASNPIERTQT